MPLDPSEPISASAASILADAFATAPYGLCVLDRHLVILHINELACALLRDTCENLQGRPISELLPHLGRIPRAVMLTPFMTGETSHIVEYPERIEGPHGEAVLYWNATFSPIRHDSGETVAILVNLMEVTDQVRARQAERERAAALEAVIETVTDGLAIVDADGRITRMNRAGQALLRDQPPVNMSLEEFATAYAVRSLATDQPVREDALPAALALHGETVLDRELLLRDGKGRDIAIVVNAAPLRDLFTGADNGAVMTFRDVTQINELRAEATVAYARLNRIAQTLQRSLMPELPLPFPNHSLGFAYEAAWIEEAEIGGDMFDIFWMNTGQRQAHFVMADVSGKGLAAARRTASIKYTIRALASAGMKPQVVIGHLNNMLVEDSNFEGFATLIYGIFHISAGVLQYINAGHEPGMIWQDEQKATTLLRPCGLPLGIFRTGRETQWFLRRARFSPSDSLLLFTDGLTEAPTPGDSHEFFGPAGVRRALRDAVRLPNAEDGIQHILDTVHAHAGARLRDDLAVFLLRGNHTAARK